MKHFTICVILVLQTAASIILKAQSIPPVTVNNFGTPPPGYFFLTPFSLNNLTYDPTTYIIDGNGNTVYYSVPSTIISALGGESDFKIQPNGQMSYYGNHKFYMMDSTFTNIDSIDAVNGFNADAHEMRILSNGHYLVLAQETRTMDLSSYNIAGNPGNSSASVMGGVIQEFDQNKNLIFEWKAHDHFAFSDAYDYWLTNGTFVDWTHCNAIDVDADGNYLLSSRHLNEITKINAATGNIIWRLNGKNSSFTFTNDSLRFTGQHHIRRLPNGNYSLFNNGAYTNPARARGLEYSLDTSNMTATLQKEYIQDTMLSSFAMGNTQVLANGNTLVNHGFIDSGYVSVIIFKPDGSRTLEMALPESYATYRCYYYDTIPFSFARPEVQCTQIGGNWFFSVQGAHAGYNWSNGASTAIIPITTTGEYQVFVPLGKGWIGSEIITVTSLSNPCGSVGLTETNTVSDEIYVSPNPANDNITLNNLNASEIYTLQISDLQGKKVLGQLIPPNTSCITLQTGMLEDGVYMIHIQSPSGSVTKKAVVKH